MGAAHPSLRSARAFARLSLGFWSSEQALRAWLLSVGVLGLVVAGLLIQVGINRWNGLFFDALERKDTATVLYAVELILALALAAAASGAAIVLCKMRLQVEWRQWLTRRLIGCWLSDRRFYQLSIAGDPAKNPEYRIADDIRMATEPLVDFVIGLVGSLLYAATFVGILWYVGGSLDLSPYGIALSVPGFMVVGVLAYALITTVATWLVGRPLIGCLEARNASEATLRYELTRVRENAEHIALINGDGDEHRRLSETLAHVASRWLAVISRETKMTWVANGHTVLLPIVPLAARGSQVPARTSDARRADADRCGLRPGASVPELAGRQCHPHCRMARIGKTGRRASPSRSTISMPPSRLPAGIPSWSPTARTMRST